MGNNNRFLRFIILEIVGISLIILSLYFFYNDYLYGFTSSCKLIDINSVITSDSTERKELSECYAKLYVNKSYGLFYTSRSRRMKWYYYIIGLEDGSVMIFYDDSSSIGKMSFDNLVEDTLNSKKTYSLSIKGQLRNDIGGFIDGEYVNYIESLKEKGILPEDVYVRHQIIDNKGGILPHSMIFFTLICLGVILIKLSYDQYKGKSILFPEHDRLYIILGLGVILGVYPMSFVPRLIGFTCTVFFLISYCIIQNVSGHNKIVVVESDVLNSEPIKENKYSISKNVAKRMISGFYHIIWYSGYSERVLLITDRVINAYKNGKTFELDIYKEYIFHAVKCSLYLDKYSEALKFINALTIQDFLDYKYIYKYGRCSLFEYFKLKMEICRSLHDITLAEELLLESKPYIDPEEIPVPEKHFKFIFLYNYYMLNEDYDKAKEYANKALTNSTDVDYETYLINAEIDYKLNDIEHGLLMMAKARSVVWNIYDKQIFNKYLELLNCEIEPIRIKNAK